LQLQWFFIYLIFLSNAL